MRTDPHKSRVDCIISIFFGSAEIKVTQVYQECWHASLPRNGSLGHSMGVFSELGTREFGYYKAWLEAVIRCVVLFVSLECYPQYILGTCVSKASLVFYSGLMFTRKWERELRLPGPPV